MLGNYLQQTISADDIFRCIFFLALLGLNYLVSANVVLSYIKSEIGVNRSVLGVLNYHGLIGYI